MHLTCLMSSVALDHRPSVEWLIDQGVDINQAEETFNASLPKGERDQTVAVLQHAARMGDTQLFDYLVSRGADPTKSLALDSACWIGDPVMIAHLIKKYNFDVNGDDTCGGLRSYRNRAEHGVFPLEKAVYYERLGAIEILMENGADKDKALGVAVGNGSQPADRPEPLKMLLDAGADPDKAAEKAVWCNNVKALETCFEYGADPAAAKEYQSSTLPHHEMSAKMLKLCRAWE